MLALLDLLCGGGRQGFCGCNESGAGRKGQGRWEEVLDCQLKGWRGQTCRWHPTTRRGRLTRVDRLPRVLFPDLLGRLFRAHLDQRHAEEAAVEVVQRLDARREHRKGHGLG